MNISKKDINKIMKHITTTNSEMGDMKEDIIVLKTDISWIKKIQWFLITSSISTLIGIVIILLKMAISK